MAERNAKREGAMSRHANYLARITILIALIALPVSGRKPPPEEAITETAAVARTVDSVPGSPIYPVAGEATVRVRSGTAWLRTLLLDDRGEVLSASKSPELTSKSGQTYVATQPPSFHDSARRVRLEVWVNGHASVENARLHSLSPQILANRDFEMPLDRRNRIPMWDEAAIDALSDGTRGGVFTLAAEGRATPEGASQCVVLTPTRNWCALGSLNYSIPPWTDQFHAEAIAQCGDGAEARMALVWTDDDPANVLGSHLGGPFMHGDWGTVRTHIVSPPEGARNLRVVLLAKGGPVRFDEAALITNPPKTRIVKVLVNQAGYGRNSPKTAVVMTNFYPQETTTGHYGVQPLNTCARTRRPMDCAGRVYGQGGADWGWYFWRADFSDYRKKGKAIVSAQVGDVVGTSSPVDISNHAPFMNTADLCVDFFYVQRCGFDVPGWHKACHMDDARLKDGSHRDLTGGWHSAGDYNKISWEYGDGGVMYALVNAYASSPWFFKNDRDADGLIDVLDEARWGAEYLSKLQIPETGGFYNHIEQGPDRSTWMRWCPPEEQTDGVVGTADDPIVLEGEAHSPLAIGGWARLGALLDKRGVPNRYLSNAVRNWEWETAQAGAVSPLLLISSIDLFKVTADERYLAFARHSADALVSAEPRTGMLRGGYADSGDVPAAALAHFALEIPDDSLAVRIKDRLRSHIDAFVAEPDNPFGISKQKFGDEGYYLEPSSALGHNYEFLCRAWSALKVHRAINEPRALVYALDQISFVLGCNPYDLCMFEGAGTNNPPRYHHRYKTIAGRERGAVPGAIPNGFVRDMAGFDRPGFDMSTKGRDYPSYRTSEPWLVHNVFYLLAIAELNLALG